MDALDLFPRLFWLGVAGIFGSIWGSFANVVIWRWPLSGSVVHPPSHCPSCGSLIAPYDNIPVLSFLLLRGRCRHCGAAIAVRYPLVELAVALLSVACFKNTVLAAHSLAPVHLVDYALTFAFCWTLVVVAFIDLATQLIPTLLTSVVAAAGLMGQLLLPGGDATDGALGVIVGFGSVWALGHFWRLVRGELGMGLGDAYLLAMVGAFLGWQGALLCLVAGAIQGALIQLTILAATRRKHSGPVPALSRPVPFGPFLAIGGLELVVFGDEIQQLVRTLILF